MTPRSKEAAWNSCPSFGPLLMCHRIVLVSKTREPRDAIRPSGNVRLAIGNKEQLSEGFRIGAPLSRANTVRGTYFPTFHLASELSTCLEVETSCL